MPLQGGTVGNVHLVSGTAETAEGEKLPYRIVLKIQKKWERYGDPGSWRREYDLYSSDLGATFSGNSPLADMLSLPSSMLKVMNTICGWNTSMV